MSASWWNVGGAKVSPCPTECLAWFHAAAWLSRGPNHYLSHRSLSGTTGLRHFIASAAWPGQEDERETILTFGGNVAGARDGRHPVSDKGIVHGAVRPTFRAKDVVFAVDSVVFSCRRDSTAGVLPWCLARPPARILHADPAARILCAWVRTVVLRRRHELVAAIARLTATFVAVSSSSCYVSHSLLAAATHQ